MSENLVINEAEPISDIPAKRGRGRPRKTHVQTSENPEIDAPKQTSNIVHKRRRGRPRKHVKMNENPLENPEINAAEPTSDILPKRGRGRPRKSQIEMSENPERDATKQISLVIHKRGRGRPRKQITHLERNVKPETDVAEAEQTSNIPPKRGRGRPPKSKVEIQTKPPQTTHIAKERPATAMKDKFTSQRRKNKLTTKISTTQKQADKKKWRCGVSTCMKSSTDPEKKHTFHKLPNDERRSIWMYLGGITSICGKRTYICSKHFNEEDYHKPDLQKQLRSNAVPSKHLPLLEHQPLNKDVYNDLTFDTSNITVKLHETINVLKNFKKKHEYKQLDFISFYLRNSSAYEILEKPLGLLPTLQLKREMYKDSLNFSKFSNLINKKLFAMDERDKVCFVTCVQISIEPKVFYCPKSDKLIGLTSWRNRVADSVKILIAHGVNSDWHIPLDKAYINQSCSKYNTKSWIEQTIKTSTALNVIGYVLYPSHVRLFANLDTLKVDVKYQKYHFFFDLQLIMKLLYFNFKSNIYCFGEFIAKWDDLKEMCALDCKRTYPLAPNLTASNINLTAFNQLTYEHIKDVFSNDTAAALRTYTKAGLIEAEGTAIFIQKISLFFKLFDSNVELTNDEKESIINEVQEFLKSIKNDLVINFVDTLIIIMNIYREDPELFSNMSKYLLNNYVHKFVDKILNNCIGEEPTSMDIENAFRRSLIENLIKPTKKKVSFDEALNIAQTELTKDIFSFNKTNEQNNVQIKPSDYKLYMLEREDRILYVAGYILKKCILHHNTCSIFKNYVNTYTEDDKLLSKSIQKEIDEGYCSMLKNDFVEFIELLELVFLGQFHKFVIKEYFIKLILKSSELQSIKFTGACPCFPSSYARELFVRIRVDYVLRFTNMNYEKVLQNVSL